MLFKLNVGTVSGQNIGQPSFTLPPSIVVDRIREAIRIVAGINGRILSYNFADSAGGDWEPETIVVAIVRLGCPTMIDEVCRAAAVYARQDCVASVSLDDDTIKGLTFHPDYSGEEYTFDPAYFVN
jgi:hypothetical protein